MQPCKSPARITRFGPFELELDSGVLRKHGVRIRLQAQPFQVLTALLENRGAVVTRDELRHRLWPDDTFVDFEHSLNAALTRLRHALGDSAERPRYVETLAKRGYRFIGEVQAPAGVSIDATRPDSAGMQGKRLNKPRTKLAWIASGPALLVLVALIGFHFTSRDPMLISRPVPLTAFPGSEANPALSPDGKHVAFSWDGGKEGNFDIYVVAIGTGTLLRVTTDPARDVSPAWSPDGRTLAFLRINGQDRAALLVVPSTGGPEHRIAEVRNDQMRPRPQLESLSWSPDGRWVAVSHREPGDPHEGIYLFSITGEKRRLTASPQDSHGDHQPAFSPDGRELAFCRLFGFSNSEIFVVPVSANHPGGEARWLTNHKRWSTNPVWTHDSSDILYVLSESGGTPQTFREVRVISASGNRATEKAFRLEDEAWQISAGRHLVYSRRRDDSNIWRSRIPAAGEPPGVPELFITSTLTDGKARYSPDGSKISFVSSRSGSEELWISNADGSNEVRLTSFGGPLIGPPAWSPDGQRLAFHARPDGQADLFVIDAAGGPPSRLTNHTSDDNMPSYSRDGRWVYFNSIRTGERQIWRMPSSGGDAVQITVAGGFRPVESPNGKALFYLSEAGNTIRQVPVTGGPETDVVSGLCPEFGFTVTTEGIVYPAASRNGPLCEFRLLASVPGRSRTLVRTTSGVLGRVISVSPDGKYLLFEQEERPGMDLMLVANFRLR